MSKKTIQIILTDGSPNGIKTAEVTNSTEQVIFVPRPKINEVTKIKGVDGAGIYFLFGESDESEKPIVYVGQSRNCIDRIKKHDQEKDFWNYVVIVISKIGGFNISHIEYLEKLAIETASNARRYILYNGQTPKGCDIPENVVADLEDNFEKIKILLPTLGFPIFDSISKSTDNKMNTLICKARNANAEGEYRDDGFVVFKGSRANKNLATGSSTTVKNLRQKLISQNVLTAREDIYEFSEDYLFNSPSAAAAQVLARNSNGWIEWKDRDGKTLHELKRK
jgi:hypothetical protein